MPDALQHDAEQPAQLEQTETVAVLRAKLSQLRSDWKELRHVLEGAAEAAGMTAVRTYPLRALASALREAAEGFRESQFGQCTRQDVVDDTGDEDILFFDGLDSALIGVGYAPCGVMAAAYDYDACVEALRVSSQMTGEEAEEWMHYNVLPAHLGDRTPVFLRRLRSPRSEPHAPTPTPSEQICPSRDGEEE